METAISRDLNNERNKTFAHLITCLMNLLLTDDQQREKASSSIKFSQ